MFRLDFFVAVDRSNTGCGGNFASYLRSLASAKGAAYRNLAFVGVQRMMRFLVGLAGWLQNSPMAISVGGSDWAYPFVQLTHFAGLSLWLGNSVAVDVRLLGVGKGVPKASRLSDALFSWNWIGFGIAVIGGFLLFSISAERYVLN